MVWKPGQSGNPSGRPKSTKEQLEALSLARKGSPDAMREAIRMMQQAEDKLRIQAMKLVLEYGLGKPTQVIDQTVREERKPEDFPRAERIAALRKALEVEEAAEQEGLH